MNSLLRHLFALGLLLLICSLVCFPQQQPPPLKFVNNYFITGDYVVGGVGLGGNGDASGFAQGTITIPDPVQPNAARVPDGADVVAAFLYWQTVEDLTTTPPHTGGNGFFRGYSITGKPLSGSRSVAWNQGACSGVPQGNKTLQTYRADVLAYLPVEGGNIQPNNNYTVRLPDSGSGAAPMTLGATLVLIYRVLDGTARSLNAVIIYDGTYASTNATETMDQQIQGFYQPSGRPAAKLTHIVGGGSAKLSETVYFGATPLLSVYPGLPPFPGKYLGKHGSWDSPTWSVASYVHATDVLESTSVVPGSTQSGCVSWGAVIFGTTVPDTDHDGLLDVWKLQKGYQDFGTGEWVALPGASDPAKGSDLFVEVDWLEKRNSDGSIDHTHLPKQQALDMVGDAFQTRGITVHFDVGPGIYQGDPYVISYPDPVPLGATIGGNAIDEDLLTCTDSGLDLCVFPNQPVVGWDLSFLLLKNATAITDSQGNVLGSAGNFQPGRKDSYHYVLFGHSLGMPRSEWTAFGKVIADPMLPQLISIVVESGTARITIQSPPDSVFKSGSEYLKPGDQRYCGTDPSDLAHYDQNCDRVTITGAIAQVGLNGVYQWTTPPVPDANNPNGTVFTVATIGVPDGTYDFSNEPLLEVTYGGAMSTSGHSDLGGADSAVTFGLWPSDNPQDHQVGSVAEQAGTLMHELGHALALVHGGAYDGAGNPTDLAHAQNYEPNCKPNYLSIMNYLFQVDLLGVSGNILDYSDSVLPLLSEGAIWGGGNYFTRWYTAPGEGTAAKYHCDGTPLLAADPDMYRMQGQPSSVAAGDMNFNGMFGETLHGYDDWRFVDLRQIGATGSDGVIGGLTRGGLTRGGLTRGGLTRGGLTRGGLTRGGLTRGGLTRGGLTRGGIGYDKDSTYELHTSIVRPPGTLTAMLQHWSSAVQLDWHLPSVNLIRRYNIYREVIGGTGTAADFSVEGAPPVTTYTDNAIESCVTYRYSVSAVDSEGKESQKESAELVVPCSPSSLTAQLLVSNYVGSVMLSWGPALNTSGDIYEYNVYRGAGGDAATTLIATVLTSFSTPTNYSYTDNGAQNNSAYSYAVTAVLADNQGCADGVYCHESAPATVSNFDVHWTVPQAGSLVFVGLPSVATYSQTYTLKTSGGSGSGTISYVLNAGPCTLVGDQLTANSGTGSCTVTATKAGDYDYEPLSSSPRVIFLGKANATIVVTPYNVMYDGNPHTATGTATGANGGVLAGLDLSGTTHTNAGTYTDKWTFNDPMGNYTYAEGSVKDLIVGYTFIGFLSPLKLVTSPPNYSGSYNLGKAVPIKWQVRNTGGIPIPYLTTLANLTAIFNGKVSCSASLPSVALISLYTPVNGVTGNSTFRYDTNNQQFVFNWDTTSVSTAPFGAGCYTLVLQLADGSPAKQTLLQLK